MARLFQLNYTCLESGRPCRENSLMRLNTKKSTRDTLSGRLVRRQRSILVRQKSRHFSAGPSRPGKKLFLSIGLQLGEN